MHSLYLACWRPWYWPAAPRRPESASVDDKGAGPTVQTAQIFNDAYGVTSDAGYSLPAIPIDRVKPEFRRQIVSYQSDERPGTIIVNTRERHLYYILPNGEGRPLRHRRRQAGLRMVRHGLCRLEAGMAKLAPAEGNGRPSS